MKTLKYPFGECFFYDRFAHFKFLEEIDEVTDGYGNQILKDLNAFYGSEKYVFISERGAKTRLEPQVIKGWNLTKMKALAVVSPEDEKRRNELTEEQRYFKGSFAFFTTYEAAEHWARTFDD